MPSSPSARRRSSVPRHHLAPGRAPFAVALSSLALLGALPTAAHAAGWVNGPRFTVAAGSIGGDFVEAPDGSSTATWFSGSEEFPPVLQVQHARPNGSVDAPLTLGAGASPAMATSTTNMTAVAWIGGNLSDGDRTVRVTLLDASGAVVRNTAVATLTADEAGSSPSADVALDAAGKATVVWTRVNPESSAIEVVAANVRPNGASSTPTLLGESIDDPATRPTVASAPGGTAWAGWITPDASVEVTRLTSSGGVDVPATQVSADDDRASAFHLAASAGGAAIAWAVPDPLGEADPSGFTLAQIAGARLTADGPLVGAPFGAAGAVDVSPGGIFGTGIGLAVGPNGTVSLGWTRADSGAGGLTAVLSRFAPGQATAAAARLSRSNALGSLAPTFGAAPDGSLLASWLRIGGVEAAGVAGVRVAPDGTIGTAASTLTSAPLDPGFLPPRLMPQADDHGAGIIGVGTSFPGGGIDWSFSAFRLDVVGPTVTVDAPSTAVAQTPVRLTGTVADPDAPLTWDFGDGSTATGLSVNHAFAGPGSYTVTARATDDVANETVVTRKITVTPVPTGGPSIDTGGTTPPPLASLPTPSAAGLRVSKAIRKGARVTVTGTISSRATGKVTIAYAQKVGRKTIRVKRTATVAKGRWRTTLALPRTLTRGKAARGKAAVTVSFVGTVAVKRATAKRAVSIAKVKKPKKARTKASEQRPRG